MPCLKFLAPEALAAAIIGKGGAVIAAMRQGTQAKIALTEHNDLYPGTDCRVLTAQASTEESLAEVTTGIVAKLADLVRNNPQEPLGMQVSELKLKTLAPRAAIGGLIGKGGASIKQLRESSSAKIAIGEAIGQGPNADQTVTIVGTQQALETVMAEVNHHVQSLSEEAWFQSWAATAGTVSGTGTMGGRNNQLYSGLPNQGGGMQHSYVAGGGLPFPPQNPGVDLMVRVAGNLPPYVMQDSRGFALSCVVPNRLVGGLIGRGGSGTKEVQSLTNTKIGIREIPGDPDNRTMNIAGPLANTCAAYMMMMKRYLDAEAASSPAPVQGEGRLGGNDRRRPAAAAQQPQHPA